jgi:hypothetical protein
MEQAIEIWEFCGKMKWIKHAIKSSSENRFVSKNPLFSAKSLYKKALH